MTSFEDRGRGFEAKAARNDELEFKAAARRNRALGRWAGEKLGLSGEALETYVLEVMRADLKEKGDDDVLQKVLQDFAAKEVDVPASEVRVRMDELLAAARNEISPNGR